GHVVGLLGLDTEDDVEDDLTLVHLDGVVRQLTAGGVAAPHLELRGVALRLVDARLDGLRIVRRNGGGHLGSSNSAFSSSGITGSGCSLNETVPSFSDSTMFCEPQYGSAVG